jgi:hypothetical protein
MRVWRIAFPLIRASLFLLHLSDAEANFNLCVEHPPRLASICFPYPAYVGRVAQEGFDLNVIVIAALAPFHLLPASVHASSADEESTPVQYAVTLCAVGVFWYLIGVSYGRIRAGLRFTRTDGKLHAALCVVGIACSVMTAVVIIGASDMTVRWRPVTLAAAIPLLWVAVAVLRETRFRWLLHHRAAAIVVPLLLTLHFSWLFIQLTEAELLRNATFEMEQAMKEIAGVRVHTVFFFERLDFGPDVWLLHALPPTALLNWESGFGLSLAAGSLLNFGYWHIILRSITRGSSRGWLSQLAAVSKVIFGVLIALMALLWILPNHHHMSTLSGAISLFFIWWASRNASLPAPLTEAD